MEYLMTYGWAILIIAIVVGVLYYLGVFNSANLAPRAQPGSCQVFRPNGPGTSYDSGLSGTCNNELPEYVAQFNGASYISIGATGFPTGSAPRSIFAWVYVSSLPSAYDAVFSYGTVGCDEEAFTWLSHAGLLDISEGCDGSATAFSITPGTWHFIGWTYSGGTAATLYLDGQSSSQNFGAALNTVLTPSDPADIGRESEGNPENYWFSGSVANVQIYNTSLSPNEVTALYDEGIGGAPIKPQSIVGWWPLNGNPNDYSGNLNQGTATAVTYTSSWSSGYSAP